MSVKVSAFILGVIYLCIVTACICLMASTKDDVDGYTAFSMETLANNTQPAFTEDYSLVSVFAVFFPGFTGCLAGANLSGDLQDANESIAKGTILALISAFVVYIAVIFTLATTVQRDTLQVRHCLCLVFPLSSRLRDRLRLVCSTVFRTTC